MSAAPDFLATLPDLIAAQIHDRLPGLRTCRTVEGNLDAAELQRTGNAAPAVLIAALGLSQEDNPSWPQSEFGVSMAAFVVTKNERDLSARVSAWTIVQSLAVLVPENDWGLDDCGPAIRVRHQTLVNRETRALGLNLSALSWEQRVVLMPFENGAPITPELYVSRAPAIGPDNIDAYEQIGGAP